MGPRDVEPPQKPAAEEGLEHIAQPAEAAKAAG